jgi:anhydro-N-acetylmuramic acid kinase
MIAVGLMSGTSLDGIDAALVRIRPKGDSYRIDLLNFATLPYEDDLLARLRGALPPNAGTVEEVAQLHHRIGEAFSRAALHVSSDMPIDYIASHGQTIWHDGDAHVTLQIADPFVIRESVNATVCYDFRSADCAAGGHGAPLAKTRIASPSISAASRILPRSRAAASRTRSALSTAAPGTC